MKPRSTQARLAAIAVGLKRYFTGEPCAKGHVAERHVSGNGCVECAKANATAWKKRNAEQQKQYQLTVGVENQRRWYAANRGQANAATRRWQAANPEQTLALARAWQAANPDKVKAIKQRFKETNPGIWNAYAAKRRATEIRQTPIWADHDAIETMYGLAAIYRQFGFDVHVDHEVPLQGKKVCGLHTHHNLQILPARANQSKSNRFEI